MPWNKLLQQFILQQESMVKEFHGENQEMYLYNGSKATLQRATTMGPQSTSLPTQSPFLPWPLNQPTNRCVIIMQLYYTELYGTINNINGGALNNLHVLRMVERARSWDAPPTKQQYSCGAHCWPSVNTISTSTWPGFSTCNRPLSVRI